MAQCPKCKCRFRTLEDEEGMHACPRCGFDAHAPEPEEWELAEGDACARLDEAFRAAMTHRAEEED